MYNCLSRFPRYGICVYFRLFPFVENNQCSDYSRNPPAKSEKQDNKKAAAAFIKYRKRRENNCKNNSE